MGTGWRGIRTAEARAVQTRPTAKGRGAAEEVDTYFYLGLLLLPQTFVLYKTDILRESPKCSSISYNGRSGVLARILSWCLPDPAHTSNNIFLTNDLNSDSKRLGD